MQSNHFFKPLLSFIAYPWTIVALHKTPLEKHERVRIGESQRQVLASGSGSLY